MNIQKMKNGECFREETGIQCGPQKETQVVTESQAAYLIQRRLSRNSAASDAFIFNNGEFFSRDAGHVWR
jgi:hypothetical protein